jgi:carbon-monoxide dehydrogenase medium subunit
LSPFYYIRPAQLDHALDLLTEHGSSARLLAGGTDLLVRLNQSPAPAQVVIDLKKIPGLNEGIVETDGSLRIGALVVMREIINDARIRCHFPALVQAARVVGSVQIRNRATLAGNICNASPAADTAPPLLVYGATINLVARDGRRSVPINDFFTGPRQTALRSGELVESIDLPIPEPGTRAAFQRITRRKGVDLAIVNLCCAVLPNRETRFAFGAVGPRPFLVSDTTGALASPHTDTAAKDVLLRQMIAHARPISDVRGTREYRMAMLEVLSRRALRSALERDAQ